MDEKITIKDVARLAGVSLGTASRVVNGAPSVTQSVRDRVERAIAQLGYKPNIMAQSMRGGNTRTIGIMIRSITIPTLARFVRAVQDVLQAAGYTLLITCSEDHPKRELELLGLMSERRVDGMIMTTCSESNAELAAARKNMRLPLVLLDRPANEYADSVLLDHYEGMMRAINHLVSLNHRRIALITGSSDVYPGRERLRAYRDAVAAGLIEDDPKLVRAKAFDSATAFVETSAVLGISTPPTAILIGGIDMLPGSLRSIRARKLRIPGDLSVIGAADSDLAMLLEPAISVVRWDYAELGISCANLLLERIAAAGQPFTPREIMYPTELLVRESCAPVPRTD